MVGGGGQAIGSVLLGDDSGLPRALIDDFCVVGMSHIMAISG